MKTDAATMQRLTATHISDNLGLYEAARSNFFILTVDGLNNLVSPRFNGDASSDGATDATFDKDLSTDYLSLNVVKSSVPSFQVQTGHYRRGNDIVNFATTPEWKDGSFVVDDVVGLKTKDILQAWLYKAYNPHTRAGGRMSEYKKTCTLMEYTQDYELIRTWKIYGAFITDLQEGDFDKENSDKRQITCILKYDRGVPISSDPNDFVLPAPQNN